MQPGATGQWRFARTVSKNLLGSALLRYPRGNLNHQNIALVALALASELALGAMATKSETRDALKEVCAFIARDLSAKIKEDAAETLVENLKQVHGVCDEQVALGANTR
jgi:hypothetical protein